MTLEKTYQPHDIEKHWYALWENQHYFAPSGRGEGYCIMLPPPNVTGSLHMGHGFGFTLMDVLIRYQRMSGKNTHWQAGTDHAGIATQMVVERKLLAENKTRKELGREAFIKKIWEWKEESGGNISRQLRRLGASVDWQQEKFTMDEDLSYAVREVFIRLYQEGLIYRGKRLVNWDPVLLTAISDLEVINQEEEGFLWHIRYPLEAGGYVEIATTRPETLLGDVAVAVHPEDTRYQSLIGKYVKLPLTDRRIPIIADSYVDPSFGTGCLKITPAHDFNDYAVGQRHGLEPINIFTPTAHLNEDVPAKYQGLGREAARKQIVADLESADLLVKTVKHTLSVPRGDRSHAIIEPYLTFQWYVKSKPLAEPAIRAVETGQVKFIPENWNKTYFQWMHNIEDWCISRQLWWGHRIPVWYDEAGNCYVGHDEAAVRKHYELAADLTLRQDEDVLDTWFSSALWPFSTLGWPEKTVALKQFFPTNVLVTGFDIIFFWVARMVMMSLKFTGQVPFKEVYITGLIRDAEGQKMSKSKGNVLDPIDLIDGIQLDDLIKKRTAGLMQPAMAKKIEKNTKKEFPLGIPSFGTDALRLTFCSLASYTREIRFDIHRLTGYRNFCNKLWNAARFVLMNLPEEKIDLLAYQQQERSRFEIYIKEKLQTTINVAHEALAQYRFDLYAQALYEFTWNEYCDWYLEIAKPIINDKTVDPQAAQALQITLIQTLETLLRLLHPIMPYITEEIWQQVAPLLDKNNADKSIMLQPYPRAETVPHHEAIHAEYDWLKAVITAIRTMRSEMNISPAKMIPVSFRKGLATDKTYYENNKKTLLTLAKIESANWLEPEETLNDVATAIVGELEIFLPLTGFVNRAEEAARLQKEIAKLEKDLVQIENKLANPQFIDRAPAAIVAKERVRLEELKGILAKLVQQLASLQ